VKRFDRIFKEWFDRIDRAFQRLEHRHGLELMRYSLAVVFLWYGFAKPLGISPADAVVKPTFLNTPILPIFMGWRTFFDLLGTFEGVVGLLLLSRRTMRIAVGMLVVQMVSTFAPFMFAPELAWTSFPFVPSAVGLYIVKNFVLLTSGLVLVTAIRPGSFTAGFDTRHTILWLRIGLVISFVWSGLLTAAVSSDPGLWVAAAIPNEMIADKAFIGLLGVLEVLVGLYVLGPSRTTRHVASYLAIAYLVLTMLPVFMVTDAVFAQLPFEPSFEGVYIFKDLVLVAGVLVSDSYHSFEWGVTSEHGDVGSIFGFDDSAEDESEALLD
jgi:uncharacterized membrane protein YkgB